MKGGKNMESRDLFVMIGLTVVLAVVVSLATISFTGNVVKASNGGGAYISEADQQTEANIKQSVELAYDKVITELALGRGVIISETGDTVSCDYVCAKEGGSDNMQTRCAFGVFTTKNPYVEQYNANNPGSPVLVGCNKDVSVLSKSALTCHCVAPQ
jgi:hypothetical protein